MTGQGERSVDNEPLPQVSGEAAEAETNLPLAPDDGYVDGPKEAHAATGSVRR